MWPLRKNMKTCLLWFFSTTLVLFAFSPQAEAQSYQGFGATTPGGSGRPVVHITNLSDSGPGSLREALSAGNRTVVFDVGGEIVLSSAIRVTGAFITIDGHSSPSPGITLRGAGLSLHGARGAHDIIVRGIRIRGATATESTDSITVAFGAYNIVIDHVSVDGSADGNIDITFDSHDVTVSRSILSGTGKNMLIKYNPSRVTLHHNLFVEGSTRNPQVRIDDAGTPAAKTTLDMRNNIVWDWSGYGTLVWQGPRANIVNNYYSSSNGAIKVSSARAYVAGNFSADNIDINRGGNETSPFPAALVDTQDACTAANLVLADAGVRPLDSIDQQYLSKITIPPCSFSPPTIGVSPDSLSFDATVGGVDPPPQELKITNEGGGALSWKASFSTTVGQSWLFISPTSGMSPSGLTVTANSFGLPEGLYEGQITIEAQGAENSPQSIPVTLVVDPPPAGLETLQLVVASVEGDAREDSSGAVKTSEGILPIGKSFLAAFQFVGVTIPPGAVIESAALHMYAAGNEGKKINVRYLGEAGENSAPLNQLQRDLSNRPKTGTFVDDIPGPWTRDQFNPSPDLSSIIQEIVNYPNWVSGNSLTMFIADNGSSASRNIGSFESKPSPTKAVILTTTYQAP